MSTRKILALLLAVVMACSLFVSPALAAEDEGIVAISDTVAPTFTDVDGHWAKDAIARWAEAGIIEGDGDGTVQPGRSLKRAELLTILARLLGLKETAPADTFTDVPAGAWYAEAVLKCAKAGIVQGFGNGMAQPESPVDREQAIVMIGRALGVKPAAGHSLDRFDDKDAVSDWAAPYMVALTSMDILSGIPQGDGVIVAPQTNIDRASTFALLDKAIAQYVTAPCTVTVDDVNKFVVINSAAEEAGDVTVTGKTAGVVVAAGTTDAVVLNNATVGTVKVDAPVDVTISRGSNVTDLDANAAADVTNNGAVTNLNTNADDVTFDGNKPSNVNTAENVKPATDSKGNEVTEAPASSGSNNGGSTGPRPTQKADLVPAPLFDQAGIIEEADLGKITVTSSKVSGSDNEYNVTVKGENIMNHTSANAGNTDGHWVGFGMPAAPENDTYKYTVDGSEVPTIAGRTIEVNDKTYNTVYISEENDRTYAEHKIVVTNSADETVATYNVTCDVTFWSVADADVKVLATEADTTAVIEKLQADGTPWAHKFAKGLGLNAAVSGNTVTLDGETTLGKLESTYLGTPGCDGYLTYVLQVTDEAIKGIKLGNNAAALDELDLDGISLVMNKKIYDGSAKSFASAAATTFSLTDAAGRVQDEITVTVDASAVTIEGLKKATFMDGDKVVATLMDAARVTAPAVPAHTDEVYYTGNWVSGETKVAAGAPYTFVGDAKEITFTAEAKPVGAAVAVVRPDGVAGDDPNFSYADAYTAAGIGYANGHITVDQSKTVALLNAAKGDDAAAETAQKQLTAITQMSGGEQANCLFIGLAVAAPDGATTLFVDDDEKTFPSVDQAGHDVFQAADGKYYYISYYPGIKADGSVCEAKTWPAEQLVWKNGTEVIKVENLTVTRDEATLAELTVTFKADGKTVETKTVAYNAAIGELPEVPAAKPGYTGGKWVLEDGTDITATSKFTTDTTVEATYTAIEYTIHYDGVAETAKMTVESTEDHTLKAAPTADEAHAGYHFNGWQILTACGENDEGAVEDQNEAGKYYKWVDFSGKVAPADLPAKAVGKNANCIHFKSVWAPNYEVSFEAMSAEVYKLYKGDREFGVDIPELDKFQTTMTFETGAKAGSIVVKGELLPITDPAYNGFNGSNPKEQTGYYLLFQFEAPKGTKASAQGDIVTTIKKTFTTAALDVVGEGEDAKEIFSFIWWVAEPTAEANTTLEGKTIELTIDWDGNKADGLTGTKYTLDLSGVTLKAAEPSTPGQGGEESASLSAVETEEVIVLVDAIVPSDDEVMEIPVLD